MSDEGGVALSDVGHGRNTAKGNTLSGQRGSR